jgi:uncharacterized protein (DUF1800 family)
MADDRAAIAHLLRRTTFGPIPGQVEALATGGLAAAVDAVLGATPSPLPAPPVLDQGDGERPPEWWLRRMRDPAAGLHEKLTWFWHGHLTSEYFKVGSWRQLWDQHQLLRTHALGNYRTMLQEITVDPAMLIYLDGDPSEAVDPNENYARELMELFTIGVENVLEENVRSGAKALAGWDVDWQTGLATFRPEHAISTPVVFLGRSCLRAVDVVNAAVDHPACAPFVATKIYRYLHGTDPTPERRTALGNLFRDGGYEIRPLVEAIVREPAFFAPDRRHNRARTPVEYVSAAFAAIGSDDVRWATHVSDEMGQLPFFPPNVAGWPPGNRWLAANVAVCRAHIGNEAPSLPAIAAAADPVQAALEHCSLFEVSARTREALDAARASLPDPGKRAAMLLGLAVSSPDMALA